jgi:hypothetical protein
MDLRDPARSGQPDSNSPNGSRDGQERKTESDASAITAHLAGEPDTLPPQWCRKCNATVVPEGRGQCPRCGRVLRHSFLARRHPVNKLRKQHLLDKLIAEYRPQTTLLHATCELLAGTLEQLEVLKPGSAEWDRLTNRAQQLGKELEASRPPRVETDGRDDLTTDQFIEQTTEILRTLLRARDFEHAPCHPDGVDGGPAPGPETSPVPGEGVSPDPARNAAPMPAPGFSEPASGPMPEPDCPYCLRPCVGPEHVAFAVLHWRDPQEVRRRNEDDLDQRIAARQGWPTERMIDRAREREVPETDEQRRQRELRERLGWETPGSTLNADTGLKR